MESKAAVSSLAALAHEPRLGIFRLLVKAGPEGLAAGDIARRMGILPNTLSASLNVLSHAGLVTSRRQSRSVIYAANYEAMSALLAFLMEDCCGGDATICVPLVSIASRCSPAQGACQ
jgi:DNA-binding transcriptional ArsR family regulator